MHPQGKKKSFIITNNNNMIRYLFLSRVSSNELTCIRNISFDKKHLFSTSYIHSDLPYDYSVKDRISALQQENERLKQEADKLKSELEYWEVRNGCKYRPVFL